MRAASSTWNELICPEIRCWLCIWLALAFAVQVVAAPPDFKSVLAQMTGLKPDAAKEAFKGIIRSGIDWDYEVPGKTPGFAAADRIEEIVGPLPQGWFWSVTPDTNRNARAALIVLSKESGSAPDSESGAIKILLSSRDETNWLLLDFAAPERSFLGSLAKVQARLSEVTLVPARTNNILWAPKPELWLPPILCDGRIFQRGARHLLWGRADKAPLISFTGITLGQLGLESTKVNFTNGIWSLPIIPVQEVSSPFAMEIRDEAKNPPSLVISNLLAGDVWLIAGDPSFTQRGRSNSLDWVALPIPARVFKPVLQVSEKAEAELNPLGQVWTSVLPDTWLGELALARAATGIPQGFIALCAGGLSAVSLKDAGFEPWLPTDEGVSRQTGKHWLTSEQWVSRADLRPWFRKCGVEPYVYSRGEVYDGTWTPIFKNPVSKDVLACPIAGAVWIHGAWQASQDLSPETLRERYTSGLGALLDAFKDELNAQCIVTLQLPGDMAEVSSAGSILNPRLQVQLAQLSTVEHGGIVVAAEPDSTIALSDSLNTGEGFKRPRLLRLDSRPAQVALEFDHMLSTNGIGQFMLEQSFTNSLGQKRSYSAWTSSPVREETNTVVLEIPSGLSYVSKVFHLGGLERLHGHAIPVFDVE